MAITAETRATWLSLLFSTEPADRPRAEAGVRDLYASCGLPGPRYFLWFDSPFNAAWTVAMLLAKHDDPWARIVGDASRFPAQRQRMEAVQADICHRLPKQTGRARALPSGFLTIAWTQTHYMRFLNHDAFCTQASRRPKEPVASLLTRTTFAVARFTFWVFPAAFWEPRRAPAP